MKIDKPIVHIIFKGNVKDRVLKIEHTYVASYEALKGETQAIILIDPVIIRKPAMIEMVVESLYCRCGKIKSCTYYKDGATFEQLVTNN